MSPSPLFLRHCAHTTFILYLYIANACKSRLLYLSIFALFPLLLSLSLSTRPAANFHQFLPANVGWFLGAGERRKEEEEVEEEEKEEEEEEEERQREPSLAEALARRLYTRSPN